APPMDEAKRAGGCPQRESFQLTVGASGNVSERPGRVEKPSLPRVAVGETRSFVARIVDQAIAVGIAARVDGASPDPVGCVADYRPRRRDDRGNRLERFHHRTVVGSVDDRTRRVGYTIDESRLRAFPVELRAGGEHSAADPDAGKRCASRLGYLLDGRLLRTRRTRLPGFQVRGA